VTGWLGRLALAALLALGLLAAGCGGDDDEETAAEETVTQEDFAAQATAICAQTNEELSQASPQEAPPLIEEGLADLEALEPPPGEEETFDR
jgi:ABC-type glycerol-3-phosphate transport system substrate-binding protein